MNQVSRGAGISALAFVMTLAEVLTLEMQVGKGVSILCLDKRI